MSDEVKELAERLREVDLPAGIINHWRDFAGQHVKICREDAEALALVALDYLEERARVPLGAK